MKIIIFYIFATLIAKSQATDNPSSFPKIIWTFWDKGFDSANLFTQLCLKNKQFYAQQSGWQFRFLTNENVTKYLSQQSKDKIHKFFTNTTYKFGKEQKPDIYRFFLIYQNGGMWLDSNTMLLGNLSWVNHLKQSPFVYNKISSQPEILTFTHNIGVGRTAPLVYDQLHRQNVYLYPGMQAWAFVAKKNSKLIKQCLETIEYFLSIGVQKAFELSFKQNFLLKQEYNPYFFVSDYPLQYLIQNKQKQIDQNSKSQLKYAIEYYKMWSIDSVSGPFQLFISKDWNSFEVWKDMSTYSLEQQIKKQRIAPFLLKFTGRTSRQFNSILTNYNCCLKYSHPIQQSSILNTFLLKFGKQNQVVQSIFKDDATLKERIFCFFYEGILSFLKLVFTLNFVLFLIICAILRIFLKNFFNQKYDQMKRINEQEESISNL